VLRNNRYFTFFLFGMSFLQFPYSVAHAKNLYVNGSTGNDATTWANNSASTPWRTIGRAAWGSTNRDARNGAEAARAGDIVMVMAGTYSGVGTNSRNENLYYTENSGTAGNPIIFRASGNVVLTQSGRGSMIGCYNRNYVTWDGFTINEAAALSSPDTGPVTLFMSTGCSIENLTLIGNGTDSLRMDNHTGIRIEASPNTTVRNSRIRNVYTGHNVNNGACIQVYSSVGLLIEHNELSECGAAIFLKGGPWSGFSDRPSTIRYNYIHDIGEIRSGIPLGNAIIAHAGAPYTAANPVRIYQNIVRHSHGGCAVLWPLSTTDPFAAPQYAKFVNNTLDGCGTGLHIHSPLNVSSGHTFWNNIVTNSGHAIAYNDNASNIIKSRVDLEHNVYFTYSPFAEISNGTTYTLPTWRSTYGQDGAAPASQSVDPLYVGAGNFHLQAGSPARTLGVDYLDLNGNGSTTDIIPAGAYITGNETIGIGGGSGSPPPPPPPPPGSRCDVNGNGSTDVIDVQQCVNQVINPTVCSTGDINQDDSCTVVDVQRVVNAALGGQCVTQ
jgi:hypothetical protein